jgi:hypothetical protein
MGMEIDLMHHIRSLEPKRLRKDIAKFFERDGQLISFAEKFIDLESHESNRDLFNSTDLQYGKIMYIWARRTEIRSSDLRLDRFGGNHIGKEEIPRRWNLQLFNDLHSH